MSEVIEQCGGIFDKFNNGSLLAVFGALETLEHTAQTKVAVDCAQLMHGKLTEVIKNWRDSTNWDFNIRIGLTQGEILLGTVGTNPISDFIVAGPLVDLVCKISSKGSSGDTLISQSLIAYLDPQSFVKLSRLPEGIDGDVYALVKKFELGVA